jgi:hypothetical protein
LTTNIVIWNCRRLENFVQYQNQGRPKSPLMERKPIDYD